MPKRKVPKETDNKVPAIESDKAVEPIKKDETVEPLDIVNKVQPSDSDNTAQLETDNKVSAADIDKKEPETNNEPLPTESENKEPIPTESDSKLQPTEKEKQETLTQNDNVVPSIDSTPALTEAPKETEDKETLAEIESKATPTETPSQTENKETPVGTNNTAPSVESVKEVTPTDVENKVPLTDSVENIEKYTDNLKSLLPTKAVVCIGEYPINVLLKGSFVDKKEEGVLPIFVEKSSKDVIKWSQGRLDHNNIVCLDEDIYTHFWYDILPYVIDNESFFARIKSKPIEKLQGAIIISSTWNGVGAALLPTLNSQFKEWNINTIALPLLPSKVQPLDGQFNTFASIGILASKEATTLVLVDRDNLENYMGIDRSGFAISGNTIANYLLDLMLAKETFVPELCELSKSFGSKMFTVLLAPGVSLKIYGSLENMLNTTLLRPLFTFDLSTATLLCVLIRMPFHLKEKLPRGKIELAIANWFKDKADLESIYITDLVYVEDSSDRIDIALFVGGFDTATRFAALEKRVEKMKNKAVKKGSITEEDWELITKSLLE